MRKTLLTLAAAACIAGGLTISAEAMPLSAAGAASTATANAAHLILVREGCGGGFHRNRYGRCVPNRRVRRYYRRRFRRHRHCYTRWTFSGPRRVCYYR
jgi:hypothetical protein